MNRLQRIVPDFVSPVLTWLHHHRKSGWPQPNLSLQPPACQVPVATSHGLTTFHPTSGIVGWRICLHILFLHRSKLLPLILTRKACISWRRWSFPTPPSPSRLTSYSLHLTLSKGLWYSCPRSDCLGICRGTMGHKSGLLFIMSPEHGGHTPDLAAVRNIHATPRESSAYRRSKIMWNSEVYQRVLETALWPPGLMVGQFSHHVNFMGCSAASIIAD